MRQTPANGRETPSFKIADEKIENLLKRLNDKRVCPCCTARALAMHGASLAIPSMGSVKAMGMFEKIIIKMHKHNIPAPDPMPSAEAH